MTELRLTMARQTRMIIKGSSVHQAVIYQVEKGKTHEYQGRIWKVVDAYEKDANHIVLILDDTF